jgi:hypothetical protein
MDSTPPRRFHFAKLGGLTSTQVWDRLNKALRPLSTEGMHVGIDRFTYSKKREVAYSGPGKEVRITCTLYFRDTDDEGNPAGLWGHDWDSGIQHDEKGDCVFCGATDDKPREELDPNKTKGRFRCPIESCYHWAPKQFKEKTYAGTFRIVYGGEAIFEGPSRDELNGEERMTNEEQIEAIKHVITETFKKN